jgi:hypothetical protein
LKTPPCIEDGFSNKRAFPPFTCKSFVVQIKIWYSMPGNACPPYAPIGKICFGVLATVLASHKIEIRERLPSGSCHPHIRGSPGEHAFFPDT